MKEFSAFDQAMMRRALALAEKGLYTTSPNPRVGCVLTQGERVVGKGWHERSGGPHAEAKALVQASATARGAATTSMPAWTHISGGCLSRRPRARNAPRATLNMSGPTSTMTATREPPSTRGVRAPDIPAAKFRPVGPRTTTRPPVMYSQPWSPTPSMTVSAPLLRTAKRSPAMPRKYASPPVAP